MTQHGTKNKRWKSHLPQIILVLMKLNLRNLNYAYLLSTKSIYQEDEENAYLYNSAAFN